MSGVPELAGRAGVAMRDLPYTGRVLVEHALRHGSEDDVVLLARRLARGEAPELELAFRPARVLMQDFTAVPLLVDLAAMRDRLRESGREPEALRLAVPVDVVVDHSVQVDVAGDPSARSRNEALEFERNRERYAFLRWAEAAIPGLTVLPPSSGIVHQVNLERLVTVVATEGGRSIPDTVIGTDSHTTMVNGLGVLGWGVGGLEAFAVMLGVAEPVPLPPVVGVRLTGRLRPGVGATDLVLALTERLRASELGGAMVEFCGGGVATLSAPDRCTVANMAPEYGAMTAFFPVDRETVRYLRRTGRSETHLDRVERYCRSEGLWREGDDEPAFRRVIEFDLGRVERSLAGPAFPHQRVTAAELGRSFGAPGGTRPGLRDGDVVIAAITSCTNTSNPRAMIAAGLLARAAAARGLSVSGSVKTSLSPGSQAVVRHLEAAGLMGPLEALGFHVVGFGCMTCNGGSGALVPEVAEAIARDDLRVCAVVSGNRNFQGRIHPAVRAAYLGSPALVVALALAGTVQRDLDRDPIAVDPSGRPVWLAELWPSDEEIDRVVDECVVPEHFTRPAAASPHWSALPIAEGPLYPWSADSTYLRRPPYLDARPVWDGGGLLGVRALLGLGDQVSTDHISPVGSIAEDSPAGRLLRSRGVEANAFNSYGSRRGDHEVMARGTFTSPRLRNDLVEGLEGGWTVHWPSGDRLPIHEVAVRYAAERTPLAVLAGERYGMGSSRDWAAKGPWLLGVRVVLAGSFERIHRANLCAMGILPLALPAGTSWRALGLDGSDVFSFTGLQSARETGRVRVLATRPGSEVAFDARPEVASRGEWDMLLGGGLLPSLMRRWA